MTSDEETGIRVPDEQEEVNLPNNRGDEPQPFNVMDMNYNNDDDDEDDVATDKPVRKMTGTSDSTSVTGMMSDDGMTDQDDKMKPSLDSLHEDDIEDEATNKSIESCLCCIWLKRILLFWVIFAISGFAVVMIGARMERDGYQTAAGTSFLYQTPQVCGVQHPLADAMGTTYDSVQEAHDNGAQVAHCGPCGACSTAHDMAIMSQTTDSLTRDSTRCAFKIFLGRRSVEKCMEERVGFTPACEDCWLENVSCSFKSCKFTCIKQKLFRKDNNKEGSEELNDCLKCDERMCGPGFIKCSGSNRRRMGIISDIERNAGDQCQDADVDWFKIFKQ